MSRPGIALAVIGVAAAAALAFWLTGGRTPEPLSTGGRSGPPSTTLEPAPIQAEIATPPERAQAAPPPRDLDAARRLPVAIRLDAPPEQRVGVPVTILWEVNPIELTALETVLHTDVDGIAEVEVEPFAQRPPLFWADLGFPTQGMAARPIPAQGGTVTLPLPLRGSVQVQAVEADGGPLLEHATAELRVAGARPPGDRWHRVALTSGHGACPVEIGGFPVAVRVRTASGREGEATFHTPVAPDEVATCRVELAAGNGIALRLLLPDGSPAAAAGVGLRRADTWAAVGGYRLAADATGSVRLHLPRTLRRDAMVLDLLVSAEVAAGPHYALLHLDHALLHQGGDAGELRLQPAPVLAMGWVVDAREQPVADLPVQLEIATEVPGAKAGEVVRAWRPLGSTRTLADGAFVIRHFAPADAQLQLRAGPADAPRGAPLPVRAGATDVVLRLPVRRGPFRRG